MTGCSKIKLEQVCNKITDGSHWSPETTQIGFPMASVKDMEESGINLKTCRKISKVAYLELVKNDCKPLIGDVLIAKDGSYLKQVFNIKKEIDVVILSSIAIIRPNPEKILPDFLKYIFLNPEFKKMVSNHYVSGAAIPRIVLKDFKKIPLSLPPLDEQERIAGVLGALDDKIELLREQNKTLESMAQAIYQSWFVDFDIVHAKRRLASLSGGRGIEGEGVYSYKLKSLCRQMRKEPTKSEHLMWQKLRDRQLLGCKFRRQFAVDDKYIADFACLEKKLIIEIDGGQHNESVADETRTAFLKSKGFHVIRFWNNDVLNNIDGCLETIASVVKGRGSLTLDPSPTGEGSSLTLDPSPAGEGSVEEICQKYHITPEIYDLFPSTFTPDGIPTGWEKGCLGDVAQIIGGGTPSTEHKEYFARPNTAISWITPKDLSGFSDKYIVHGASDISLEGLKNSSAKIMPKGAILFSSRAPIGYCVISDKEITTNQGFKSLLPKSSDYTEYLYHFLKRNVGMISGYATGSTFKEVSGTIMKNIPVLNPDIGILAIFEKMCLDYNEKQKNNSEQIRTLTQTRDTLLPQLISGKVRV